MPKFKIHHITKYTCAEPVRDSANKVLLFPIKDDYQQVLKQQLTITNAPLVEMYKDYYGNETGSFMHAHPHSELTIDSTIEVITLQRVFPSDETNIEAQWKHLTEIQNLLPYLDFLKQENFSAWEEMNHVAHIEECKQVSVAKAASMLNEYVYKNFQYEKGITNVETKLDEIWKLKAGVCQDFAHVLCFLLRHINIPARYVSGYICPNHNGMRGESATHAWVEAYIPFYGWLGLDPTNNCLVNDLHVRLAVGRNFTDCSPVKGTYRGAAEHLLEVGVSVAYEDGHTIEETVTASLKPQPTAANNENSNNSYRRFVEMMQQQQ